MKRADKPVAIIGAGPAGSVAALCLRKLGRQVAIFERAEFPRHRIGESLLPGTLSILKRLGVSDRIDAAGFPKKRAATFLWGEGRPPWSFTFATPKTAPWVFDHAYQVTRAEFDQILLDAAVESGADLLAQREVTDIDVEGGGDTVAVSWRDRSSSGVLDAAFVIDAAGASSIVARKLKLRRFDQYFKNLAIYGYWKGGKRYKGDLEGNTFSVTFQEGWIWIIPLKDDIYSVGVITGADAAARMKKVGPAAFYRECLEMCPFAMDILKTATLHDKVCVVREWAYDASRLSSGRIFLCGDSACFIDPLFSQGVHLATYSAMLAAAGIDHLLGRPGDARKVEAWYDESYRSAYDRYHKFLASFYSYNDVPSSKFWSERKIEGARDKRFAGRDWFASLTGQHIHAGAEGIDELEQGAATLANLWHHGSTTLDDKFDETELALRRVRWASELVRDFHRMATIRWKAAEVRLISSYQVNPTTFRLESQSFIGDETGRAMTAYTLGDEHRELFETLKTHPLSFRKLTKQLKALNGQGTPIGIVGRLLEEGFVEGFDEAGEPVKIRFALRFGGVGSDDDFS